MKARAAVREKQRCTYGSTIAAMGRHRTCRFRRDFALPREPPPPPPSQWNTPNTHQIEQLLNNDPVTKWKRHVADTKQVRIFILGQFRVPSPNQHTTNTRKREIAHCKPNYSDPIDPHSRTKRWVTVLNRNSCSRQSTSRSRNTISCASITNTQPCRWYAQKMVEHAFCRLLYALASFIW